MIIFLAGLPILFWFVAQFIPLDRYGNATRQRLAKIEEAFNEYFQKNSVNNKVIPVFQHYTEFSKNFQGNKGEKGLFGSSFRVRTAVGVSAVVTFIVWLALIVLAFRHPTDFAVEKKSAANKAAEMRQDHETLKENLSSPRVPAAKP